MALGGGTFSAQDKILPGSYINFVSAKSAASTLGMRGVATMPLLLDWGVENEVFKVTSEDFIENAKTIFGYSYDSEKLKGLRDLFKNIKTLYAYRLNGGGEKANNDYAIANYGGTRGNDISIVIKVSVDEPTKFVVETYLDNDKVDEQLVTNSSELKANKYVSFKDVELTATAGVKLAGGTNKTVTGETHSDYLKKIESYSFNALGVITDDTVTKNLYVAFAKRMREERGIKFQVVLHNIEADYMGVVNVVNKTEEDNQGLIYWTTGVIAGCAVNKSNSNKVYDGEYKVNTNYTQSELEKGIKDGHFMFHKVGDDVRVLYDINSMVTEDKTYGELFKDNQVIRVIDQIATDISVIFNTKYNGEIPNDTPGRESLWGDIVKHHKELEAMRAIENFNTDTVKVTKGQSKKAVVVSDAVEVIGTMTQLYMTVNVA